MELREAFQVKKGESVLLTDTLSLPATFLVPSLLSSSSPTSPTPNPNLLSDSVIILCLNPQTSLTHYQSLFPRRPPILLDLKVILFSQSPPEKGNVSYVFEKIHQKLFDVLDAKPITTVVLDDLSTLFWTLSSQQQQQHQVLDFVIDLFTQLNQRNISLISILHRTSDAPHDPIFQALKQSSHWWLDVSSLGSQSKGELSIRPGILFNQSQEKQIRSFYGSTALLVQLRESAPRFHYKGGSDYL